MHKRIRADKPPNLGITVPGIIVVKAGIIKPLPGEFSVGGYRTRAGGAVWIVTDSADLCPIIADGLHLDMKVTYHDSCHLGRRGGIFEAPRQVLEAIPGLELVDMPQTRENAPCCGRQLFAYTDTSPKPYVERVVEATEVGASALVTNCPGCQVAYILGAREAGVSLQLMDITDLVAMGLDIAIRDPKIIARMARQAYDARTRPNVQENAERAKVLFAPDQEYYPLLPGRRS